MDFNKEHKTTTDTRNRKASDKNKTNASRPEICCRARSPRHKFEQVNRINTYEMTQRRAGIFT